MVVAIIVAVNPVRTDVVAVRVTVSVVWRVIRSTRIIVAAIIRVGITVIGCAVVAIGSGRNGSADDGARERPGAPSPSPPTTPIHLDWSFADRRFHGDDISRQGSCCSR